VRNIPPIPEAFSAQVPAQPINDFTVTIITVVWNKAKGAYLFPVVDKQMQLKAVKLSPGLFPRAAQIKHVMAINAPIVVCLQRGSNR